MKTTSLRARTLACALLATTAFCGLAAQPAAAQTARQHRALDSNGVDLTHGDFVMAFVEGSIGSGDGELALVRSRIGSGNGSWHVSSGGHQWDLLYLTRSVGTAGTIISVNKDDRYELFSSLGTLPTGSSLTAVGAEHHYRTADGTLIVFGDPTGSSGTASTHCNGSPGQGNCSQLPLSISTPDGRTVSIGWEVWQSCTEEQEPIGENNPELDCSYWARIDNVSNSFGYRIAFTYASNGNVSSNGVPPPDTWQRRTGALLHNDSVGTAIPQASLSYVYPSASPPNSVVEVTDTGGRLWRFSSDGLRITGIRRPGAASDSTMVSYGGVGSSVSSVTSAGVTTQYSRSGNAMTVTQALPGEPDLVTTIVSDLTIGRPTSVTDPLGRTTAYEYDSSARLRKVTRPEGNSVQYSYDGRGNVTETRLRDKAGNSANDIVASASYPATCANPATCNSPDSVTDALGNTTAFTYDPTHGGVLTATAPAPTAGAVQPQTRYGYTLVNGEYRLTQVSQCRTTSSCAGTADEVKTSIAYDSNGNVQSSSSGDGAGALTATTTMAWDAVGNLLTVDGPLAGTADTSRIRYNGARQVVGTISPDPDGPGQPLQHRAVRNVFDPATGLPLRTEQGHVADMSDTAWDGFVPKQAVETGHDSNARPVETRLTANGTIHALTQTSYDALGRPDCTAQRMNKPIFPTIAAPACQLGTQGGGADDHGPDRIVRTLYDRAGRVAQVRIALGTADEAAKVTYGYRPNGQVEFLVDAKGNRTQFAYDGHDRPERTSFPSPTGPAGFNDSTPALALSTAGAVNAADFEQQGYDPNGNVTAFTNRAGESIGFTFDALNRMIAKNLPGSELDVAYGYDLLGQMTSASQAGDSLTFAYDALGRNVRQTGASGDYESTYDLAGRRIRLDHPDAFFVTQEYLVTGELVRIRENGGFVLATIEYDQLGRRDKLTLGNGAITDYGYDSVSRLETLSHDLEGSGTANDNLVTFAYNPAGQIAGRVATNSLYAWTGHGSGSTTYAADGLNRLTSQTTGGSTLTFSHDARGNRLNDETRTYAYDSEGKARGTATGPWHYDPPGRLSGVGTSPGTTPALAYENYVDRLIAERTPGNAAPSRRHVFGPGVDEPLVWYEGSDRRFLSADERGSIVAVSDGTGTVRNVNRYDEYGRVQNSNNFYLSRFAFTGQRYFSGFAIYHFKNRIYDQDTGRFMQTDPIGYAVGPNLYAYVGGDPVNLRDPLGLCGYSAATTTDGVYRGRTAKCEGGIGFIGGADGGITFAANRFLGAAPIDGGLGEGGGSGGDDNQCPRNSEAGAIAIPVPGNSAPMRGVATAGILRVLGLLGAIFSLSGDTPKDTYRTFRHYGYSRDAAKFAGGLRPGSFATDASGPPLTGEQAQSLLALPPRESVPDAYYNVTVDFRVPVMGPSRVQPKYGQPGGGVEYRFPKGTPPGSVGPPNPTPAC